MSQSASELVYPSIGDILHVSDGLLATKYLAAVALVLCLWDHIITLDDEIKIMWRGKKLDATRGVFICIRYGTEISLIYVAYGQLVCSAYFRFSEPDCTVFAGLRGNLDNKTCKIFAVTLCLFTIIYSTMAYTYMTFRHYSLWDHGKTATIILIVVLICTYIPVVVMAMLVLVVYSHSAIYEPIVNTCLILNQPNLIVATWGCMCAFDFFTIILAVSNSLHRPHRNHSDVLTGFKRDGAVFFISIFLLHFANMLIFKILPPLDPFLISFLVWAMVSITFCRLILRVEALRAPRTGIRTWVPGTEEYEMGRWSSGSFN